VLVSSTSCSVVFVICLHSFNLQTFLSYRLSCKQGGRDVVSVRHRYSEFEAMRTELKDRYHPFGILVAALPPKNQISSMTNTIISGNKMIDLPFVKERTFGLTMFCEVCLIYFIKSFLTVFVSVLFCCRTLLPFLG
jgi:hypothetical protein